MIKQIDLTPLHNLPEGGLYSTELVDGKHVHLKCSRCNKSLCDVWITQPNLKLKTKIVAYCDYCNDRSYEHEIDGKFHIGGTDDSGLVDIKHEFIDNASEVVFQKMSIKTKRLK